MQKLPQVNLELGRFDSQLAAVGFKEQKAQWAYRLDLSGHVLLEQMVSP